MNTPRCLRYVPAILLAVALVAVGVAAEYELDVIMLSANADLEVHMPANQEVKNPTYLRADGKWAQLNVNKDAKGIFFALPPEGMGSTVVLLNKPDWLTLPDSELPAVKGLNLGRSALDVSETVHLGHIPNNVPPLQIVVSDQSNPLALHRLVVSLDGRPVEDFGGSVKLQQSKDGRAADINVDFGDLPPRKHTLSVSVSDASPQANTASLVLRFNTGAILNNGDFEEPGKTDMPNHWTSSAWDLKDDTKYEIKQVDGGRSGKCLMMHGIAGSLNTIAYQSVDLVPGRAYVLCGYARTDGGGGWASIISQGGGERSQYDSMPRVPASEDWTEFSWDFTAVEGAESYILYLRNGKGKVYFDDIKIEPKQH
jgi:hypothetical protein